MKKFIRFVIVLVLILVAAILILGVIEPTNVVVVRTTVIKAPKDVVFEQISKFHNWPNWSPWYRMDSSVKLNYFGSDGQPGSGYTWEGNQKVGSGEMRDSNINGTQMTYAFKMIKPYKKSANGYFNAEDTAGMTKVTWSMTAHMPYPMNAMDAFMNMDKLLGGDFESGLNNLKQYVESHNTGASSVEVKEVDFPAHTYEGVRSMVNWSDMHKFFMDSYSMLGKDIGGKINGAAAGLYFTWDTVNKRSDMAAVFPVVDTTMAVKGAQFFHAGPGKAVMAVQKGGYSQAMKYHMAIAQYMAAKGMKPGLVIEEYPVTQQQEPDSNKWVTNIYYLEQ
jgi:hypothetical protein